MSTRSPGPSLEHEVLARCAVGEDVTGDACVVKQSGERWLIGVLDGLGHGAEAASAAGAAKQVIERADHTDLGGLLTDCDVAMRDTRGAVAGLALVDYGQAQLTWMGVGNIEGRVVQADGTGQLRESSLMSRAGIVGYSLPALRQQTLDLRPGALIILFTDGIDGGWAFPQGGWRFGAPAAALADWLMGSYHKGTDDSLACVARY